MKRVINNTIVVAMLFILLSPLAYCQYRVFHDCGMVALLKGSEWVWLFGGCK